MKRLVATRMLKRQIARLDVPDFLDQITAAGGQLWACRMSAGAQLLFI